jgi:hypothetical protein
MFDNGQGNSIFGGGVPEDAFADEQQTPALPHPGQPGTPGDGQGNYYPPTPGAAQAAQGQPHAIIPIGGGNQPAPPTMATAGQQPMAGEWGFIEPQDASPEAGVRSAGFTALFATMAVGAGYALGGPLGAAAGLLLSGAAANGYRAQKWWGSNVPGEKHEAVVSSVFSAAGLGVGGWLAYKAYQTKAEGEEEE